MNLATIALAVLFPAQAPAAPAKVVPMVVEVRTAPKAAAGVQAWAKELRAALDTRKEEFRAAKPGETPEFVVRIDSVGRGQGSTEVLNGAFILGHATRPFTYSFADVRSEAEKLARNLRKYADQMRAASAR
ncbi:MAG TPA: hypothetical protein VLF95_11310 [Vicinamibacteria bacterium]|nr:hypothetical protein [Vicinamibacteria bacterium]